MSDKWVDEGITTRTSRTPEQRAADARAGKPAIAERFAKLEARVDELHDLIEQQQAGARHLAGRIDKVDVSAEHTKAHEFLGKVLSDWMRDTNARLDGIDAFKTRVIAAYPLAGKPTIQKQCDESWTLEDSKAFYEGARQMSDALAEEDNRE